MTTTNAPPAPLGFGRLSELSDDELLASTRKIVGRSDQLLAALLAHLGEVEARGIHRVRGCASVYTYCVYELRMSEDAAFRRARAARIAREYPVVLDKIAAGEIHLTALLMLGPHLTEENHRNVLERAKHRTKKEVARLVRMLDPLPDVAPVVEPLGPIRSGLAIRTNPTWGEMMAALRGPVRELEPGDRPRDWIDPATEVVADDATGREELPDTAAVSQDAGPEPPDQARGASDPEAEASLSPQRYKVQFTATQEYVDLLEEARDLMSHTASRSLDQVHLRAMRLLVRELKKRKYAVTDKSEAQRPNSTRDEELGGETNPRQRGSHVGEGTGEHGVVPGSALVPLAEPRRRTRYIPARVRRAVWQRDQGRCTFVDARRERCRETSYLQLHHVEPHGRGGAPSESNLRLRCHAHNALAAEEDFGRDLMTLKKSMTANKPDGLPFFRLNGWQRLCPSSFPRRSSSPPWSVLDADSRASVDDSARSGRTKRAHGATVAMKMPGSPFSGSGSTSAGSSRRPRLPTTITRPEGPRAMLAGFAFRPMSVTHIILPFRSNGHAKKCARKGSSRTCRVVNTPPALSRKTSS